MATNNMDEHRFNNYQNYNSNRSRHQEQQGAIWRDYNSPGQQGNQNSGHWDRSDESRKRHGMWGNRNNPDYRASQVNRGESSGRQGDYDYGQRSDWNRTQDSDRSSQNRNRSNDQGGSQGLGIYHAGGDNSQGSRAYAGESGHYSMGAGDSSYFRDRDKQNRQERGYNTGHQYGAGSYAGELNRDYGPSGTFRRDTDRDRNRENTSNSDFGTSGWDRYHEMGGYYRDHTSINDRDRGAGRDLSYGSSDRGGANTESFNMNDRSRRDRDYGNSWGYGDNDRNRTYGGMTSRGGDYNNDRYSGSQRGSDYNRDRGNTWGSNDQQESRSYGSFDRGRNYGDADYERSGRGSNSGDRGHGYYQNSQRQLERQYGLSDQERDKINWNRGYGSTRSNYAESGNYGGGNRNWDNDRNYDRNHDEDRGFFEKAGERLRSWFGGNDDDRNNR